MKLGNLIEKAQHIQEEYGAITVLVEGMEPNSYYLINDLVKDPSKPYAVLLTQLTKEQREQIAAQQKAKWEKR